MISEKRIMGILFEIEINKFEGGLRQVGQTNQLPTIQINHLPNQPALHMNQHISTQPNVNLPIQVELVPLFTWTKCFFVQLNKKL